MNRIFCLFVVLAIFIVGFNCAQRGKYDYVIKNGTIVDGTGNLWYKADIGIRKNKIEKIGNIPDSDAKKVLEVKGKVVSPGFIDNHNHADFEMYKVPTAQNYITQGVTTVVGGNCGFSPSDISDFFAKMDSQNIAINLALHIGHGEVRKKVMGEEDRDPTPEELEKMKQLVRQGMEDGAVGFSTGLIYVPGVYAKTDEIIKLAKVAAEYGGLYATHMRNEGPRALEALAEAIEIGEKANIRVEVAHFKISSYENWGNSVKLIAMVDEARRKGLDIKVDQYSYNASQTTLQSLFPPWALEGGEEKMKERLENPEIRKKIKEEMASRILHNNTGPDMERIFIASCEHDSTIEGKTIAALLRERGKKENVDSGADLILDIIHGGDASAIYFCMSDEDVERIMVHPVTMHSSDGGMVIFGDAFPHPRNYGAFPRVLGRYVREKKLLRLEDAVRKMTSMPAAMTGIRNSGLLVEGFKADITIFNPETVMDKATFDNPHQHAEGIEYVFVNGVPVVYDGKITGSLPGEAVLGPGKR